ncbi:AAA family ATPase [Xanthomonas arboricola]|uniref:AAA family ATPase n=1 Tax=Xanthomonas arboricola TaxID=56448 RepID=UPI000E1EA429|nr:AAA family ATPase [Xanthomonas arboricola]
MSPLPPFADLSALATHVRSTLDGPVNTPEKAKRFVLLYGHNGVGKTQLSMAFKNIGRQGEARDTLYFNAYTEDLFGWDNDLAGDSDRKLVLNTASRLFAGLSELEMDTRIRPLLQRYADFDFQIDAVAGLVRFYPKGDAEQPIKISRGEETMFIWCFFLAIVQLAMDGAEAYQWVKYIVIDDPISSLDEHNAIVVANHLGQFLTRKDHAIKTVISTHHALFFNVLWNEIKLIDRSKFQPWLLSRARDTGEFTLSYSGDTPFFQHLALLEDLCRARDSGHIYTHHFNALRGLLEKAQIFHGHDKFSVCIQQDADGDPDATLYGRVVNIMSHGNYSFYDPVEMLQENKEHFEKVLDDFLAFYPFNRASLPGTDA